MPGPVEMWVQAAGGRVLVRRTGTGSPLLLIPGLGSHTGLWSPAERVWRDLDVISFDAPGAGRSPGRIPPPSVNGLARLAEELLDELGLDRVDVLGYSLGGTVAQTLARRAPERVRRLVLAATAPGWGCVPGRWQAMIHLYNPLRYFSRTHYEKTIGAMAGGQARTDASFIARHGTERLVDPPSLVGYYSQLLAAATWSSIGWLSEISAPTLVVAGGDDPLLPPVNSVMLAHRIPRARLQLHPGEGHLMLFDDASPALGAVYDFLTAPTLDDSRVWREAQVVTPADEREAVRTTSRGMFPWGLASAAYRAARAA
jgi:poly(3-hydroxyoctanoate) depolymerase